LIIATKANVITVPNSALTSITTGSALASVPAAGKVSRKTVKVGAVGPSYSEVISGLAVGEQVVIADRHQALPTNSSNNGRLGAGIGGAGIGGAGFGGAGFGGGGTFTGGAFTGGTFTGGGGARRPGG